VGMIGRGMGFCRKDHTNAKTADFKCRGTRSFRVGSFGPQVDKDYSMVTGTVTEANEDNEFCAGRRVLHAFVLTQGIEACGHRVSGSGKYGLCQYSD